MSEDFSCGCSSIVSCTFAVNLIAILHLKNDHQFSFIWACSFYFVISFIWSHEIHELLNKVSYYETNKVL